jgi:hypothetical protein
MTPKNSEVDRCNELKACREHRASAGACDADDAVLERLPQRLERRPRELGELVEEQDAAVGQCSGMSPERRECVEGPGCYVR